MLEKNQSFIQKYMNSIKFNPCRKRGCFFQSNNDKNEYVALKSKGHRPCSQRQNSMMSDFSTRSLLLHTVFVPLS